MSDYIKGLFKRYLITFPHERQRLESLKTQIEKRGQDLYSRANMQGHLTASALLIDDDERALLIHHKFLDIWIQPGGHLDKDEWPYKGALREFQEETGFESVSMWDWHEAHAYIPIDLDTHAIPSNEEKGEGEHFHHDFLYVLRLSAPDMVEMPISIDLNEVKDSSWVPLTELMSGKYEEKLRRVAKKFLSFHSSQGNSLDPVLE